MNQHQSRHTVMSRRSFVLLVAGVLWSSGGSAVTPVLAHEVWIELPATAGKGEEQVVQVCWGHAGERESGPRLAGQQDKLSASVVGAHGVKEVPLTGQESCFEGSIARPHADPCAVGAVLEVGIIDREMHGIAANTRMVMFGKTIVQSEAASDDSTAALGHELELIPVSSLRGLKPGDLLTVKVAFRGQPMGGRKVMVAASTAGPRPAAEDSRVQSPVWTNQAMADPETGEVTFPLIVEGQHILLVKYLDETSGTYHGNRNDSSSFSHLRQGDTYERTNYIATLTLQVSAD